MKLIDIGLLVGCCVGAYLIGSIPVGYIVARIAGIDDIRTHGSGNIGATNVARTLGARYFLPVFLLDFAKAYGTVALVAHYFSAPLFFYAASFAYLIGNGYSIFLLLQAKPDGLSAVAPLGAKEEANIRRVGGLAKTGGKGVAATVGILTAYNPVLALCIFASWLGAFVMTRTVGIASVLSAITAPIFPAVLGIPWHGVLFVTAVGAWIIMRHYENIKNYFFA
jgi:glycerol-3-phosphate acyltransferase PlsY